MTWDFDRVAELTLRPERFFPHLLRFHGDALPLFAIWICGMAGAIDRIDTQLLAGRLAADDAVVSSWLVTWTVVSLAGALGGLMIWLVGGWWYRMRLVMSGADDADPRHARLVFLYSTMLAAVPGVVWLVLVTVFYPSYHAAYTAAPLALCLLAMLFWSVWVSYRGVCRCFEVRPWAARAWFLILPMALYGTVFGAAMVASWFGLI